MLTRNSIVGLVGIGIVGLLIAVGQETFGPIGKGGSGSQTPWTVDINGAGNKLTNAGNITSTGSITSAGALIKQGAAGVVPLITRGYLDSTVNSIQQWDVTPRAGGSPNIMANLDTNGSFSAVAGYFSGAITGATVNAGTVTAASFVGNGSGAGSWQPADSGGYTNLVYATNGGITFSSNLTLNGNSLHKLFPSNAGTNNAAVTNLTVDFNEASQSFYITNNATFTNFLNISNDGNAEHVLVRIIPQLVNRTVTWPTFGAPFLTTAGGIYLHTNDNNWHWTTLTNGTEYMWTLTRRGTNLYGALTAWH